MGALDELLKSASNEERTSGREDSLSKLRTQCEYCIKMCNGRFTEYRYIADTLDEYVKAGDEDHMKSILIDILSSICTSKEREEREFLGDFEPWIRVEVKRKIGELHKSGGK